MFIGALPRTDWLDGVVARDERGFILAGPDVRDHGWPLKREPHALETSIPGVFVAGDVRARSIKRVASRRRRGLDGRVADPPVPGRGMTATAKPTLDELRTIDLFDELDDGRLARWADAATLHDAAAGERITEYGEPSPGLTLLLEGRLEMLAPDGEVEARQGTQIAPTWIGAIPTLLGGAGGDHDARGDRYPLRDDRARDVHDLLLSERPRVPARDRPRSSRCMGRITQRQQQHERLESLGTMAAGLAHELNNPASAASRTAVGPGRRPGGAEHGGRRVHGIRASSARTPRHLVELQTLGARSAARRADRGLGARRRRRWRTS